MLGPFDSEAVQSPTGAARCLAAVPDRSEQHDAGPFLRRGRPPEAGRDACRRQRAAAAGGERVSRDVSERAAAARSASALRRCRRSSCATCARRCWVLLGAVGVRPADRLRERREPAAGPRHACAGARSPIRAAIGAGRGRIVRQLLTESVVLALLGGVLGLVIGVVGIRALLAVNPGNIPRIGIDGSRRRLDWRVLLFTAPCRSPTGLVFGLVPAAARLARRPEHGDQGKQRPVGQRVPAEQGARRCSWSTEMGLALVLLVGAALFIRTFLALRAVDPGFDAHSVLTMRMSLRGERFAKTAAVAQVMRDGAERLTALPGVEVAGAACCVPLQGGFGLPFIIEGRPLDGPSHGGGGFAPISPDLLPDAFKIPDSARPGVHRSGRRPARRASRSSIRRWRNGSGRTAIRWPTASPIGRGLGPQHGAGRPTDRRHRRRRSRRRPRTAIRSRSCTSRGRRCRTPTAPICSTSRRSPGSSGRAASRATLTAAIQRELRLASGGLPVARPRSMEEVVVALHRPIGLQHDPADDLCRCRRCSWRRSASTA